MGEDLAEVDVRQRKSGKNKNLGDDGYSSPGENVHGASKRRRRGKNDKFDNKNSPEKDVPIEAIDLKGKIGKKREINADDGDDGDDYSSLDSSLDDEESSGSWLFKLVIIAIVVSLGFSLMWFNDDGSSKDLGDIISDGESVDDGVEAYVSSKIDGDNDDDRDRDDIGLESEDKSFEDKYQEYQQTSEFQDHSQWSHDYSDANRMDGEIISEVSGNLGDSSSEVNEEAEYQVNQNQGYSHNEPEIEQQPSEEWTWSNQEPSYSDDSAVHPSNEEVNQIPETESNPIYFEEQSNPSFDQQAWQYQEQQNEPDQQQQTHEQFPEQIQEQAQEQYESRPDDQQAQSIADNPEQYDNPPMDNYEPYIETGSYFECPAGSHWDGLACVDSDSYGQTDNTNDYVAQPDSTTESIIYPEQ